MSLEPDILDSRQNLKCIAARRTFGTANIHRELLHAKAFIRLVQTQQESAINTVDTVSALCEVGTYRYVGALCEIGFCPKSIREKTF